MSTVLTEERGNNPFSRFRHKTAIDHQDIDSPDSDLILADVLCQELVTLECCTRAEPTENMFGSKKLLVIAKMSSLNISQYVTEQHLRTEAFNNQRSRNQRRILHHCEVDPCQTLS